MKSCLKDEQFVYFIRFDNLGFSLHRTIISRTINSTMPHIPVICGHWPYTLALLISNNLLPYFSLLFLPDSCTHCLHFSIWIPQTLVSVYPHKNSLFILHLFNKHSFHLLKLNRNAPLFEVLHCPAAYQCRCCSLCIYKTWKWIQLYNQTNCTAKSMSHFPNFSFYGGGI